MKTKLEYFDTREALKWRFHKELCKGDPSAEFKMNWVVNEEECPTVKDVNRWLQKINSKYRVKEE